MRQRVTHIGAVICMAMTVALPTGAEETANSPDANIAEARARGRILHETIHGALQVMHRDFFDEEESRVIPSQSLEDVFSELQRSFDVRIRWLAVDTDAMNVDHQPKTEIEKNAVAALANGKGEYESTQEGRFHRAGSIRLSSRCLKCHLPNRTSTDDRKAALMISFPLDPPLLNKP